MSFFFFGLLRRERSFRLKRREILYDIVGRSAAAAQRVEYNNNNNIL